MAYFLSPIGNSPQITATGAPLTGGTITTFQAGTSTPLATYTDNAGANPATSLTLNTYGLPSSPVWLLAGQAVKFVIKDALGNLIRTIDNVQGIAADGNFAIRNRLMNGNFAVNQRAVAGTVTLAAAAYGHDRWKAGAGGCTYTFAASGADTVITISAGSLMQVVEGLNVEGGVYALANRGTATARIAVNGAGTSGAYSTASTAVPLASATATGNQTVTVEFSTGTVDRAQLEPGTVATNFERRPYGAELALCQRYYEIVYGHIYFAQTAGSVIGAAASPKVTKRAPPTLGTVAVTATETNFTYATAIVDALGDVVFYGTATATGAVEIQRNAPLSAEL